MLFKRTSKNKKPRQSRHSFAENQIQYWRLNRAYVSGGVKVRVKLDPGDPSLRLHAPDFINQVRREPNNRREVGRAASGFEAEGLLTRRRGGGNRRTARAAPRRGGRGPDRQAPARGGAGAVEGCRGRSRQGALSVPPPRSGTPP